MSYAYIDGANLHKGIEVLGWKLNYKNFRDFLKNKYGVEKAYYFIGDLEENKRLYQNLQEWGYLVVLKNTVPFEGEKVKGNVDVKLTLQAVQDYYEKKYEQAVLVTGDGDFLDLIIFLAKKDKLRIVLSPNHKECSHLLKKHQFEGNKRIYKLGFVEHTRNKLEYNKT